MCLGTRSIDNNSTGQPINIEMLLKKGCINVSLQHLPYQQDQSRSSNGQTRSILDWGRSQTSLLLTVMAWSIIEYFLDWIQRSSKVRSKIYNGQTGTAWAIKKDFNIRWFINRRSEMPSTSKYKWRSSTWDKFLWLVIKLCRCVWPVFTRGLAVSSWDYVHFDGAPHHPKPGIIW